MLFYWILRLYSVNYIEKETERGHVLYLLNLLGAKSFFMSDKSNLLKSITAMRQRLERATV